MKKIAIAGTILADVIKYIDNYPTEGKLCRIGEVIRSVGGCVPNTGIVLKTLEPNELFVSAVGKIGKDENGRFILEVLRQRGIDTCGIIVDETLPTSFTDVMTLSSGERTFFSAEGANAAFCESDIVLERLDCQLFHIGYLLLLQALDASDEKYGTKMARLLKKVRDRGIQTSIDVVSTEDEMFRDKILPALPFCDYLVVNEIEAGNIVGIPLREQGKLLNENLRLVCEKLRQFGVKKTIAIHCPELGCALDESGNFVIVPSLALPAGFIVGSVGAGDAFCAGMLYSFLYGMTTEKGLRFASCVAACCLHSADSVGGAKSAQDSWLLEKQFGRRKN